MPTLVPEKQRRFAVEIVQRLRAAGFEAYWAGGCVRDQLLGRRPVDYDVATDAQPPEIRRLFGHRRTLAVGAAFGVITVLGPRGAGQIEVATFRSDDAYSDGRHPDSVRYSDARQDALRRDFTINGLFYDPLDDRVIDFVGGQEDLARGVIRAIGDPAERFAEDKLRLVRAVRFAATFGFELEPDTLAAIRRMAPQITVVSPERISTEMHRMLVGANRGSAVRLLVQTGLAAAILPEILPADDAGRRQLDDTLSTIDRFHQPGFPLVLAALLYPQLDRAQAAQVCRRWRVSNKETDRVCWLVEHHAALDSARSTPWSTLQKVLVADGVDDLLALAEAAAAAGRGSLEQVAWCRSVLERPRELLDPPPLLNGDDLIRHGVPAGPKYRLLLEHVRNAQLDGRVQSKADALALVDRLLKEDGQT